MFTAAEAAALGVDPNRLRAQDLQRIGQGLYLAAGAVPTEIGVASAFTRADPRVAARGLTAARLWNLPLPRQLGTWSPPTAGDINAGYELGVDPRIQLASGGHARRSTQLVRWTRHRLQPHEVEMHGGVRTAGRLRTWLDLGRTLSVDDLVAIGDHLLRIPRLWAEGRDEPYATPRQLRESLEAYTGNGTPGLRQAAELIRVGSDSPAETRLRLAVVRSGLPEPELNRPIFVGVQSLGEPDMSWPAWKVCLEHDGAHHREAEQQHRDIQRRERRERYGWIEVQTVAKDLRSSCEAATSRVRDALIRRGWTPTTDLQTGTFSWESMVNFHGNVAVLAG